MADIKDVEDALVALIAGALYPSGPSAPSASGVATAIYAGWPTANNLDRDLISLANGRPAGKMHVSVYPMPMERVTTRYLRKWETSVAPAPTLTVALAGQTATIGGTVSIPQNVMLLVDRQPYVYQVQTGDTLAGIAAGLAALIPGASSVGPVVTVANASMLTAGRVGAQGVATMEIGRQERVMMVAIWADGPANRTACARVIDPALREACRLAMPDGSVATMFYKGTREDDFVQKANLYRRDLLFTVEYATTVAETETQITQTELTVAAAMNGVEPYSPVATLFD